jgi:hypothetical protein
MHFVEITGGRAEAFVLFIALATKLTSSMRLVCGHRISFDQPLVQLSVAKTCFFNIAGMDRTTSHC